MEAQHDSQVSGPVGMDKTIKMVDRNFYWPVMAMDVEDYVHCYEDCKKNKPPCHKRHGPFNPLELAYAPWDSISIDFVTQLLKSEDCAIVWVIIDPFTKMIYLIPIMDGHWQKTAEGHVKPFLHNIWKLHELPSSIISDWDPVFNCKFWAELLERLDVLLRKSTAFQAQTDG